MEGAAEAPPRRRPFVRRRKGNWRLSRIQRIRETARPAAKEKDPPSSAQPQRKRILLPPSRKGKGSPFFRSAAKEKDPSSAQPQRKRILLRPAAKEKDPSSSAQPHGEERSLLSSKSQRDSLPLAASIKIWKACPSGATPGLSKRGAPQTLRTRPYASTSASAAALAFSA